MRWCVQSGIDMHAHMHCGAAGAGAQQGCRQAWAPPSAGRRAAVLCRLQQHGNLTASLPAAPAPGTRRLCTRSALPTSAAHGSASKLGAHCAAVTALSGLSVQGVRCAAACGRPMCCGGSMA